MHAPQVERKQIPTKSPIELKDDSIIHKTCKAIYYANALCQLDVNENER